MKKLITVIGLFIICLPANAQIEGTSIPSIPQLTAAEMTTITSPNIGSSVFVTDDQKVYMYTTSGWVTTDVQNAGEVNLISPIDMDEGGLPSPTDETTVEQALQAIAPITSASGRIFYPPSIAIDASTNIVNATKDLYAEYVAQFASVNTIASDGAPSAVPIYAASELYYYVTYFDPAVFANIEISNTGVMEYDIIGQPADYNSLLNIVFVVK
ncbi:hypothetical protein [Croceitalea vernalis]|uniref:Uncharacterized protein n=1 Tax=Croceitalea vernalis TaxID=3075599 RepID=A0ABU3BKY2_9FLAO|nr:hypothetical protein [Croceitalea sp. P007]MDT0622828.1 hypothetical protein [Croceitalea sp. P007]